MKTSYEQAADLFSLLAHKRRLEILDELRTGEACVCHLQAVLDRPQAYVSQQLGILREAQVVADRREGLFVFYRVADPLVERLLERVLGPARAPSAVPGCPCPRCDASSESSLT